MKILYILFIVVTIFRCNFAGPIYSENEILRDKRSVTADSAWMTDEQLLDIGNMKESGKSATEIKEKIMSYFNNLTDEQKKPWLRHYKKSCVQWVKEVCSDEERKELKALWAAKNIEKIREKGNEYMRRLPDERKELVSAWQDECEKLWNDDTIEVSNLERRDIHHNNRNDNGPHSNQNHNHNEHGNHHNQDHKRHHKRHVPGDWGSFAKEHLSWMTQEQLDELVEMKENGANKESIANKVLFFFNKVSDDKVEEATIALKMACKELYTNAFGENMVNELKKMQESGVSFDDLEAKFQEYIGGIEDEAKLDEIKSYNVACKKLFQEHRRKRHINKHSDFESFAKDHLFWLNEEQLQTVKTMKTDNVDKSEIVQKIMNYFDEIEDKKNKETALEALKSACREVLTEVFGMDKARDIKTMKDQGLSHEEIAETVNGWKSEITDEEKLKKLDLYSQPCTMLFKKKIEKRHIHGQFESFLSQHLDFLTETQKNVLRDMKVEGVSRHDIAKKIFAFYQETFGGLKKQAYEQLRVLCAETIEDIFGADTLVTLREMRDSGMTYPELEKYVQDKINQLTDSKKIEKVKAYSPICRGIYKTIPPKRLKKDSSKNCIDMKRVIENTNSWLDEKDKNIIYQLQSKDSHSSRMGIKYILAFSKATGEQKVKATKLLRQQCDELIINEVGEEKFKELNDMIEENKSSDEIGVKLLDLIYGEKDENSCTFGNLVMLCRQTYIAVSNLKKEGVAMRVKRHPHTNFDEFAEHHLTWLSKDQMGELKKMVDGGSSKSAVGEKVMDFYDLLEGAEKVKATKDLTLACEEVFEEIFGEDAKNVVVGMKKEGKSFEEIGAKVAEYESGLMDEEKKVKFAAFKPTCKRLAKVDLMRLKRHIKGDFESFTKDHLSWLTLEQLNELKGLRDEGKCIKHQAEKIEEFYDAAPVSIQFIAKSELSEACKEEYKEIFDISLTLEVEKMREENASFEEIEAKYEDYIKNIEDEDKKFKAEAFASICKKVLKNESTKKFKRHVEGDFESFVSSHLSWMTPEQVNKIKTLKEEGKSEAEIGKEVDEIYNSLSGEQKNKATLALAGVCKELFSTILGPDATAQLMKLHNEGASVESISSKAIELENTITDSAKKEKLEAYRPGCKKIYIEHQKIAA